MRKQMLIIIMVLSVLLSSCNKKTDKFIIEPNSQISINDVVDVIVAIRDENNHDEDSQIPYDHFLIFLNSQNRVFTIETVGYSLNTGYNGSEYTFLASYCEKNDNILECETNPSNSNTETELEESVLLTDIIDTLSQFDLFYILELLQDEFSIDVNQNLRFVIQIEKFESEIISLDDLDKTIFIDEGTVYNEGEISVDGLYLRYIIERKRFNDELFNTVYIKIN